MSVKTMLPFLFALSLATTPAFAQETVQPQTQGNVSFVSGGVGRGQAEAMHQVEGSYNLHLLFATTGSGEFLSGVKVAITSAGGDAVLDTVSEGPYFYARLPPGRYQLTADNEGQAITRTITVPARGAVSQSLYWKSGS